MHGWVPPTVQVLTAVVLTWRVGWRSRRWRTVWMPVAALVGGVAAYLAHWYIVDRGLSDEPAPTALWLWIALTGLAAAVWSLGWRSARRWRRCAAVLAVPLCLLSAALVLNLWVGYFPTVVHRVEPADAGPLPDQTDQATVAAMPPREPDARKGVVVPVTIRRMASKFRHRGELVYLPPAWFATNPPPQVADGDDDRRAKSTPRRTGPRGQRDHDRSTTSRPPHGGNAPGAGVRRFRRRVQQRHRMRQRDPRQRRRPPDQGRRAVHGLGLRRQRPPGQLGRRRAGPWAAPARWI